MTEEARGVPPLAVAMGWQPEPNGERRVLIAGVGNLLRRDDGFGVEVARRLLVCPPSLQGVAVTIIETGIGGMHLVQELMSGYDALLVIDAVERGAAPGTLFLLEPERADTASWSAETRRDFFADTHYAEPSHALALAEAVGALPSRVQIVGCQVATVDDLLEGLTPAVARAVEALLPRLPGIIADVLLDEPTRAAPPVP
jgi:hydrogenase maturation protease